MQRFGDYIRHLLTNPHYDSGTVVARLATAVASSIWALVVLVKLDALKAWPITKRFHTEMTEDLVAAALLAASVVVVYRLITQLGPMRFGSVLHGYIASVWVYTAITLYIAISTDQLIVRPGQLSAVTVVAMLAVYGFIANPRREQ